MASVTANNPLAPLWRYARLLVVAVVATACGGGDGGNGGDGGPPQPQAISITVVGIPATPMIPGQSAQLSARARNSDGTLRDVSSSVAWSSTNASVLMISRLGVITAITAGQAEVVAAGLGNSGRAGVRVSLEGARIEALAGELAESPPFSSSYWTFSAPHGVATDSLGNVYVANTNYEKIEKITPTGDVSTLAGTGQSGSGDGVGAAASFNHPRSVAVGSSGTVYVADSGNHTIRKITLAGDVSTLAGTAGQAGSTDGLGAAARFNGPNGVATDSAGNVYVADSSNHTIRKITPAGQVSTLAGAAGQNGSTDGLGAAARLHGPNGVATDSAGNVYVADGSNHTIRKITPTGQVGTVAGLAGQSGYLDGVGAAAQFHQPYGIAADPAFNIYVADTYNNGIRRMTPAAEVTTIAGMGTGQPIDGVGAAARFAYPHETAVDGDGNVYVADHYWRALLTFEQSIRKITPAGVVSTFKRLPRGDEGGIKNYSAPDVSGLAVDAGGNVYVAMIGSTPGANLSSIVKVSPTGIGVSIENGFSLYRIATDSAGNVYASASYDHTIRRIGPAGDVITLAGTDGQIGSADGIGAAARFNYPRGIATDRAGNVYVADSGNHTIRKITPAGQVSTLAGMPGQAGDTDGLAEEARFRYPDAIATDSEGNVYVGDSGRDALPHSGRDSPYAPDRYTTTIIRKITPAGVVTTVAGKAGQIGFASGPVPGVLSPRGLAVSGTSLYVTLYQGVAVVTNVR
jgi:sugar lactone lactonase YvrE